MLVGVSGGPDSACLLDVLFVLSKKYDWQLRIAHVNYGLRGNDSTEDELFIRSLAKKYKLPCSVLKPKITQRANLEEALRDIRYDFFEKTRQKYAFDAVAVAHTLDDQAETLLMRLIRGSGFSGLRAMQPKTSAIIRPLLETTRKDVMHYIKKQGITYRTDSSNTDTRFFRNNIRHRLIPYLQKNFNPGIQEVLANTARIVGEDYDTLLSFADLCPLTFHHTKKGLYFQSGDLLALSTSMQKMVLRKLLTVIRGDIKGITSAHIDEVLKMLHSTKSKTKTLSFQGFDITSKGTTTTILHHSSK